MKILEKFCRTIYLLNFIKIRLGLVVSEKIYSWFGKVMFGCVWFEKTSIWNFCEIFMKIWFVLAVLEKIYSWFGLVRFGMVWFGLVWDNIQLKLLWNFHQDPTCFGCFREDLQLVQFGMFWFGMVWYGLRQHPSKATLKISSKSDLFWLI